VLYKQVIQILTRARESQWSPVSVFVPSGKILLGGLAPNTSDLPYYGREHGTP